MIYHPKNRTCEQTEEVLENYRHRAIEAETELQRHHRDFTRISEIVENACVERNGEPIGVQAVIYALALRDIRNIVG